jgi:hypothetical protein
VDKSVGHNVEGASCQRTHSGCGKGNSGNSDGPHVDLVRIATHTGTLTHKCNRRSKQDRQHSLQNTGECEGYTSRRTHGHKRGFLHRGTLSWGHSCPPFLPPRENKESCLVQKWFGGSGWLGRRYNRLSNLLEYDNMNVAGGTHSELFQSCKGGQSNPPQTSLLVPLIAFGPGIWYPVGHKGITLAMMCTSAFRKASLPDVRSFAASEANLRDRTSRTLESMSGPLPYSEQTT